MDNLTSELTKIENKLLEASQGIAGKMTRDLITVQNRIYSQLESLSWLQRRLKIKGQLPPLRGWASSPDVLLRLHTHIMITKPQTIVEFGSGASTLVIADAISQNGTGKLISIEHSERYGAQTLKTLREECLEECVDLRIGDLEPWSGEHMNSGSVDERSQWYPVSLLESIESVDLLWVDGPPGTTCLYSRYPALPVLINRLTINAEIWMDDTVRREEKDICERWSMDYGLKLQYFSLEKGLGLLTQPMVEADDL